MLQPALQPKEVHSVQLAVHARTARVVSELGRAVSLHVETIRELIRAVRLKDLLAARNA